MVFRKAGQWNDGAPGRIRTRDPLITNQVLYQLSYKGVPTRATGKPLAQFAKL